MVFTMRGFLGFIVVVCYMFTKKSFIKTIIFTGVDRKTIYDATRISYKWRSAIVHALGTKNLTKQCPLEETVQLTTEYLRSALLKVLNLPGQGIQQHQACLPLT